MRPGSTHAQVFSALGEPDDVSIERRGRLPRIHRYGDIEVHFREGVVFLVFIESFTAQGGAPSGGLRIAVDPWVIREGLLLPRFIEASASVGLGLAEGRTVVPGTTVLVAPGGVELGFIISPETPSALPRLAWLSQMQGAA